MHAHVPCAHAVSFPFRPPVSKAHCVILLLLRSLCCHIIMRCGVLCMPARLPHRPCLLGFVVLRTAAGARLSVAWQWRCRRRAQSRTQKRSGGGVRRRRGSSTPGAPSKRPWHGRRSRQRTSEHVRQRKSRRASSTRKRCVRFAIGSRILQDSADVPEPQHDLLDPFQTYRPC